ncbi:MAG: SDR family NAD(P)-dependent oxidoreductase [Acidobacteria bacterium]|nr:SDR family NAD(P)-dependent oxidoreductase [Acidobacteriota bacterium]
MNDFRGRVAVVTGGASGIGLALARRFAAEGMKVLIADIEESALNAAVRSLADEGAEAAGERCDVADHAQVETLADSAYSRFGAVHILANNAGVGSAPGAAWRQSHADWKWVLGVNLWGAINGVRAFMPRMIEQDTEGHIVNTASLAGLMAMPFGAPYQVSKFGVVALSESIYYELAATGSKLRVSVLCPAWVKTNILTSMRNRPAELANPEETEIPGEWLQAFSATIDAGLAPETVAGHVMDAIREERLYIWTHPEFKDAVAARHSNIVEGRNPDAARMLAALAKRS